MLEVAWKRNIEEVVENIGELGKKAFEDTKQYKEQIKQQKLSREYL